MKEIKWEAVDSVSSHGRSQVKIECPFCKFRFWAYNWSLCGSGKLCPQCKAKHNRYGAYKK